MKKSIFFAALLGLAALSVSVNAGVWDDLKKAWSDAQEQAKKLYEQRKIEEATKKGAQVDTKATAKSESAWESLMNRLHEAYEKYQQDERFKEASEKVKEKGAQAKGWLEQLQEAIAGKQQPTPKRSSDWLEQLRQALGKKEEPTAQRSPTWYEQLQQALGSYQKPSNP